MLEKFIAVILILVGFINLIPVSSVLSSEKFFALYGIPVEEPNLLIIMSHRAILFGLLGIFLIVAAWRTELQPAAFIAGLISMLSFIILAKLIGNYNTFINKVVCVDAVASVMLLIATILYYS
jgi:hypothetical protein